MKINLGQHWRVLLVISLLGVAISFYEQQKVQNPCNKLYLPIWCFASIMATIGTIMIPISGYIFDYIERSSRPLCMICFIILLELVITVCGFWRMGSTIISVKKGSFVFSEKTWYKQKSCTVYRQHCSDIDDRIDLTESVARMNLSIIQYGCCKPPASCGYLYKNATYWEIPESGPRSLNQDCAKWMNDDRILCYDCNSCKEAVVAKLERDFSGYIVKVLGVVCCGLFFVLALKSSGPQYPRRIRQYRFI